MGAMVVKRGKSIVSEDNFGDMVCFIYAMSADADLARSVFFRSGHATLSQCMATCHYFLFFAAS